MKIKVESDGKVLYVKKPGYRELSEAKMYSAKIFNQARITGAMLKKQLWDYMKSQKLWDDEKQKELDDLVNFVSDTVAELNKGKNGKFKKISDARQAAIDIRVARLKQRLLLSGYTDLESLTIEGLSDQAHFDCLVQQCVLNEGGTKVFGSIDEYFDQAGESWARKCADELSYFIYPIDKNWEKELPENKFLVKYNLVDADLRLVDKEGNLVDKDFKKINEEGNYIDNDGNLIDSEGNKIDKDGEVISEFAEFDNDL